MASIEGGNLIVICYLSASEILPDKRGDLWWGDLIVMSKNIQKSSLCQNKILRSIFSFKSKQSDVSVILFLVLLWICLKLSLNNSVEVEYYQMLVVLILDYTVELVQSDTWVFPDILWHPTKIYGPKVFLLTKIKPEYSAILYNPTHFPGPLVCRIRQIPLYITQFIGEIL